MCVCVYSMYAVVVFGGGGGKKRASGEVRSVEVGGMVLSVSVRCPGAGQNCVFGGVCRTWVDVENKREKGVQKDWQSRKRMQKGCGLGGCRRETRYICVGVRESEG